MRTLAEIDARLAEIRSAIQAPNADLNALQTEMNSLLEERARVVAAAEQRRAMLEAIANGTAQGVTPPAGTPDNQGSEERDVLATPEYRSAFLHHLMVIPLNAAERAAMEEAEQRAAGENHQCRLDGNDHPGQIPGPAVIRRAQGISG